jgi:chromosome segregation ATPase
MNEKTYQAQVRILSHFQIIKTNIMTKEEEIIELREKVDELTDDLKAVEDKVEDLEREVSDLEDHASSVEGNADKAELYDEHEAFIDKIEASKADLGNMMQSMKMEWILDNWDDISFDIREGCELKKQTT